MQLSSQALWRHHRYMVSCCRVCQKGRAAWLVLWHDNIRDEWSRRVWCGYWQGEHGQDKPHHVYPIQKAYGQRHTTTWDTGTLEGVGHHSKWFVTVQLREVLLCVTQLRIMNTINIVLAIFNQLTRKGAWRNIFVTHNAFGIFSKYSHISRRSGKPKVAYPSKHVAEKAAEAMGKKHGVHFSVYKCAWCDGWHISKNSENKIPALKVEE